MFQRVSTEGQIKIYRCTGCGIEARVAETPPDKIHCQCAAKEVDKASVIITSYNEGDKLKTTVDSVRRNTTNAEIILIDDASDDGSINALDVDKMIRNNKRQGIINSRRQGVAAATGKTLTFLDGHHKVSEGCINMCAELALETGSIVYPRVYGWEQRNWTGYGCFMQLKTRDYEGGFGARWNFREPRDCVSRTSMFIVPGYTMGREAYAKCELIDGMMNWGASEPNLAVKAFFTDTDLLVHKGPLCQHFFRAQGTSHYRLDGRIAKCNHLRVARVCFEEETWKNYWRTGPLSRLVHRRFLDQIEANPLIEKQRLAFREIKKRSDEEFWRGLLFQPTPEGVAC